MHIEIDHVIVVVEDLDDGAARTLAEHGLGSIEGGRHPGHGTGNRIVPLGSSYLELMAVLDPAEAASSPMGRWALQEASDELVAAAVCLRVDDIEGVAADLGATPASMSRLTPDGTTLAWRLVGLEAMVEHGYPFFIQWDTEKHPGALTAPHRVQPSGIAAVRVPAVPGELRRHLMVANGVELDADALSVTIETESGSVVL